jgi:hypothetical protein
MWITVESEVWTAFPNTVDVDLDRVSSFFKVERCS